MKRLPKLPVFKEMATVGILEASAVAGVAVSIFRALSAARRKQEAHETKQIGRIARNVGAIAKASHAANEPIIPTALRQTLNEQVSVLAGQNKLPLRNRPPDQGSGGHVDIYA